MKAKSKIVSLVLGAMVFASGQANCQARTYEDKFCDITTDVLIYRPAGLILLAGGTAVFALALPVAALTGKTKCTAKTLVGTPFNATFRRPIGTDMSPYMGDASIQD